MKVKSIIGFILIVFNFFGANAQRNPTDKEIFISGYAQKVAGNEIKYTSGVEGVDQALITRADTGDQVTAWKTSAVRFNEGTSYVTFMLYVGYDSRSPGTVFDFFVDNVKQGEIRLPDNKLDKWSLPLKNNTELNFKRHFVDSNNDNYGFLYYKVPVGNLKKGQTLQLEITGANAKELTWFMVFKKKP